jgi:hypothetical protein
MHKRCTIYAQSDMRLGNVKRSGRFGAVFCNSGVYVKVMLMPFSAAWMIASMARKEL